MSSNPGKVSQVGSGVKFVIKPGDATPGIKVKRLDDWLLFLTKICSITTNAKVMIFYIYPLTFLYNSIMLHPFLLLFHSIASIELLLWAVNIACFPDSQFL